MNKKLLFLTGEGIGNVIQCLPVLRTLKEVLGYEVYLKHLFGSFPIDKKVIPYITYGPMPDILLFDGVVSTYWTESYAKQLDSLYFRGQGGLQLLNKPTKLSMYRTEVDSYMDIARDLGVKEGAIIWEAKCFYKDRPEKFDVVISNGYNKFGSAQWKIKEYPYYEKVVDSLLKKGYSVSSIGSKDEHVKGTVDMTGLPLLDSFGVIKNAKCLLSNDTGMYHAANALSIPNVTIFTATSIKKNYDKRFHRYATIICRNDLECRPCQKNRRWTKDCTGWECRDINPESIVDSVEALMM